MSKKSVPIKEQSSWRIKRHDGVIVGYYASKELAQADINKKPYFE